MKPRYNKGIQDCSLSHSEIGFVVSFQDGDYYDLGYVEILAKAESRVEVNGFE